MIDLGLKNKVAIITGANTGIGKEIAFSLAKQGVSVLIHYLGQPALLPENGVTFEETLLEEKTEWRREKALELKKQITEAGGLAEIFEADLSIGKSAQQIIDFAESKYCRFFIISGIGTGIFCNGASDQGFRRACIMSVNFYLCCM